MHRKTVACLAVVLVFASGSLLAQHPSSQAGPTPENGVATIRGGTVRAMGVEARSNSVAFGVYSTGNTIMNEVVAKVSNGPVVATWTGEVFNPSTSTDLVIGVFAAQCLDGKPCTAVDAPVLSSPSVDAGTAYARNYSLAIFPDALAGITTSVQTVFPTGMLLPNKYYRFTVIAGQYIAADGSTTRLRTLRVEAYAKAL